MVGAGGGRGGGVMVVWAECLEGRRHWVGRGGEHFGQPCNRAGP